MIPTNTDSSAATVEPSNPVWHRHKGDLSAPSAQGKCVSGSMLASSWASDKWCHKMDESDSAGMNSRLKKKGNKLFNNNQTRDRKRAEVMHEFTDKLSHNVFAGFLGVAFVPRSRTSTKVPFLLVSVEKMFSRSWTCRFVIALFGWIPKPRVRFRFVLLLLRTCFCVRVPLCEECNFSQCRPCIKGLGSSFRAGLFLYHERDYIRLALVFWMVFLRRTLCLTLVAPQRWMKTPLILRSRNRKQRKPS